MVSLQCLMNVSNVSNHRDIDRVFELTTKKTAKLIFDILGGESTGYLPVDLHHERQFIWRTHHGMTLSQGRL